VDGGDRAASALGANAVRKDLGPETLRDIAQILKASIQYGLDHRKEAVLHSMRWARDMEVDLADKFVGMYVNDWTLDYGERGREAIRTLLRVGFERVSSPTRWNSSLLRNERYCRPSRGSGRTEKRRSI